MLRLNVDDARSRIEADEAVVIFDLDRTLHAGSALSVLARLAFKKRLIGAPRLAQSLVQELLYRKRGSTDNQATGVAEIALGLAAGITVDQLTPVVEQAALDIANSVRPGMRILLENHLLAGHHCVILSASPQILVERVAANLEVAQGVGTVVEIDNSQLTGKIVEPLCYGEGKLVRLRSTLGWTGDDLSEITSYAYADSLSDLPLLDAVDTPVAVAPDRHLRKIAAERDWPVLEL